MPQLVSADILAEKLEISKATVVKLAKAGFITTAKEEPAKRGVTRLFALGPAKKEYAAYKKSDASKPGRRPSITESVDSISG